MEEIMKKVEDFSDDEEILGAYDAEWHRKEVERVVRIAQLEEAQEEGLARGMAKGIKEGFKQGIEEGIEQGIEQGIEKGIEQGIEKEKQNIVRNMKHENIDIEVISKVTGLSIEKINNLK